MITLSYSAAAISHLVAACDGGFDSDLASPWPENADFTRPLDPQSPSNFRAVKR